MTNVILTEAAADELRDEFVTWQCKLRQMAVREDAGRPSLGMRPTVDTPEGHRLSDGIIMLIHHADPYESTMLFRHQAKRTNDPVERYNKAVEILAASHFQHPAEFTDRMTALFGPQSAIADRLLSHGRCILGFEQFTQWFRLDCKVLALDETDPLYLATYWHNSLFNPNLPADIRILSFEPDWRHSTGHPID
ncbi:MAG: hypothetical protein SGJ07_00700 [Rhodospirillaceae bacterium]|nr:hypothetical protein [Rhodospirillaceae bacterium]